MKDTCKENDGGKLAIKEDQTEEMFDVVDVEKSVIKEEKAGIISGSDIGNNSVKKKQILSPKHDFVRESSEKNKEDSTVNKVSSKLNGNLLDSRKSECSTESKDNLPVNKSLKKVSRIKNKERFPPALCKFYLNGECSKNDNCSRLHICKEYLISSNRCTSSQICNYGLSHNLFDANNKKIITEFFDESLDESEITEKLRQSYPKLCENYASKKTCEDVKCFDLHLCANFVFGICTDQNCDSCHDYESQHNQKILETFNLAVLLKKSQQNFIAPIIFSSKLDFMKDICKENDGGKLAIKEDQTEEMFDVVDVEKSVIKEEKAGIISGSDIGNNSVKKKQILSPKHDFVRESSEKNKEDSTVNKVSSKLNGNILDSRKSECSAESKDNLPVNKSLKKVSRIKNKERFPPALCKFYLNGECSKNDNCSRLHICKEYLISSNRCTSSQICNYGLSHNLFDANNKKIITEFFDESLDESEITEKLRQSYPKLCENYASKKTCEDVKCFDLHLCANFVFGICTDQNCDSCHDYESQHNQKILETFNLAVLLKKSQQNSIAPIIFSSKLDFMKDICKESDGGKLAIKEDQTEEMFDVVDVEKSVIKEEKAGIFSGSDIGSNSVKKKQILSPKHDFVRESSEKNKEDSTVNKVSSKLNGNLLDSRKSECSTESKGSSPYFQREYPKLCEVDGKGEILEKDQSGENVSQINSNQQGMGHPMMTTPYGLPPNFHQQFSGERPVFNEQRYPYPPYGMYSAGGGNVPMPFQFPGGEMLMDPRFMAGMGKLPISAAAQSSERPGVLKDKDLKAFDDDKENSSWASAQEKVNYEKKLKFDKSDESEDETIPKSKDQKNDEEAPNTRAAEKMDNKQKNDSQYVWSGYPQGFNPQMQMHYDQQGWLRMPQMVFDPQRHPHPGAFPLQHMYISPPYGFATDMAQYGPNDKKEDKENDSVADRKKDAAAQRKAEKQERFPDQSEQIKRQDENLRTDGIKKKHDDISRRRNDSEARDSSRQGAGSKDIPLRFQKQKTGSREYASSNKDGPSEYIPPCKDLKTETIIDFILQKYPRDGKCPLGYPELLEKYFSNSQAIARKWFKKHKSQFRKEVNSSNKKFVHVCMVDVEPCQQYWRKTGCTRPNCGRFHICSRLLFQQHNANRCNFNHDLQNEQCRKLLEYNNLSNLSSEQIITLLRKRYPLVCSKHQYNICSNGDSKCDALHICKNFVLGKCPKDDNSCCLSHEKALNGSQAKRLSKDFNIPLSILRSTLLVEPLNFDMNEDVWGEEEFTSVSENVDIKPVQKDDIIQLIMNLHPTTGDCQLNNPKLLSFFDDNIENAEIWFRRNHSSFRMSKNKQDLVTVHVCLVDVEPCKMYWSKRGCNAVNCGRFHVCRKLLFEKHNGNACLFNHKFDDSKSCMLIEKNNLQKLLPDDLITILRNRLPFVCKEYQTNQCQLGEKFCESLHVCIDHLSDNCDGFCYKIHDDAFQSEQAKRICTNFSLKEENLLQSVLFEMVVTMITESTSVSENVDIKPVQKDDIIQFIMNLNPTTGKCRLNNPKLLSYFDDNKENAKIWFRRNHSSFRMSKNKHNLVTVHVCLVDVEPCKMYWSKRGCNVVDCGRFHVCRKLLFEKHNANACLFNHKFDDSTSSKLIEKNNLQKLLPDELVTILKNRFPFVCKEYQTNQCQLDEKFCESLHVCIDHLSDNCDGICPKIHDDAFQSEQAKRICTNFSLKEDDIRKSVLFEMVVTMVTDSKTFNPLKEEAICLDYLNGNCHLDSRCSLHHYKTTFMWQYKPVYQQKWIDLSEKVNKKVEKTFCDLNTNSCLLGLQDCSGFYINFQQIDDEGCFKDKSTHNIYRRLSTRSSVSNDSNDLNSTTWKWYWEKSDSALEEYSNWTDSEKIEKEYLSGNMYCQFTTDEFTYHIMFDEMKQQNRDERYFTKRNVIRRPEYQDVPRNPSSRLKSGTFPKTWPSNCAPGHLIDVSGTKRKNLEKRFLQSFSTPVKVIKIQEVCNEEFYEKYLVKKKQIGQKRQTSSKKFLYHGTSHDTVAHICAQNFDFRMSGKNATMYGKGSYFSTSAHYSHNYSSCDSRKQYFMFVAQVLVGKYTKGSSSYTRPPPLHHGSLDLYDSCVDNVSKPSMYIVFDRDQCYPRYLITYKLSSDCTNSYSSSYNHSYNPRFSYRQSTTSSSGSYSAFRNRSTSSSATSSYATNRSSFSTANVNSSSTNRSSTSTYSTGQSSSSSSSNESSPRQYNIY